MKLRAALLSLLALPILLAVPAAQADPDPCADNEISLVGLPVMSGSLCHDGAVYACAPVKGEWRCQEIAWCTFCPGPVIASGPAGFPICHDKDVTVGAIEHVHVGVDCEPGVWADTCVPGQRCRHDDPTDAL